MNNKKVIVLGIIFLMVFVSFAGLMLAPPNTLQANNNPFSPNRTYEIAADPSVSNAPIVTNPRTTNNLYGGTYETYYITANITNAVSIADVGEIEITLNSSSTVLAGVQYDNTTATWSEVSTGASTWVATATNTTDTNDMNITVTFTIDWTFPDTDGAYICMYIHNATGTGTVFSQSAGTYDIDTDVSMTPTSFISLISTHVSDTFTPVDVTFSYESSGGTVHPLAAQSDIYMTRTPASGLTDSWNPTYTEGTGVASWAVITAGPIAVITA